MRAIWRGVRSRGWRAVLAVVLLTLALAANTIVFSAADAFVFNRVPYAHPSQLVVIGGFGVLAFLLAAAGVYGVMACLVASRGREIGIRIALGADAAAIRRLVLRSALSMVAAGIALGAAIAIAAGRFVQSQLFGVRPSDPITWVAVLGAVTAVAALATSRPAQASARVDPSVLLRE
jgi:putative ABC transport system permease protein